MAEAPEHVFLSQKFLEVLQNFSKLRLYGYTEADRKKFDFACVLQRDWKRPLIGQTLWKHSEGIDKDIRMMLAETESDIWAYVARDTVKNRAILHEVIQDFRRSRYSDELFRLKILWIPQDFDADSDSDRKTVSQILQSTVVEDILFNTVFGNLTSDDIRLFLNATGILGLSLAILYEVATQGFFNYSELSKRLQVSAAPLRERIINLVGTGFLWQVGSGSMYFVSLKGRIFLELLHRLVEESGTNPLTPELRYVLTKLALLPNTAEEQDSILIPLSKNNQDRFILLLEQVRAAREYWEIDLRNRSYKIHEGENNPQIRIVR
jgi:hypothetical protein